MSFDKYKLPGKCDVCEKETDIVVCASTMGAISFNYCEECFKKKLEPYWGIVADISCAGRFPDDINEGYQEYVRYILQELGISEEKFIQDVNEVFNDI